MDYTETTSENVSAPYRSKGRLENVPWNLHFDLATSNDVSDTTVLPQVISNSDNLLIDGNEKPFMNGSSFREVIQHLIWSCITLGINLDYSNFIGGFDATPTGFIGRGKSFYTSRLNLAPGVNLEIPAKNGPKKLVLDPDIVIDETQDFPEETLRLSRKEVVACKTPLVELNHHGRPKDDATEIRRKAILLEVKALTHKPLYEHENIVDFLGVTWVSEIGESQILADGYHNPLVTVVPVLLLEYADHGTLRDLMYDGLFTGQELLTFEEKQSLCRDIVEGLFALHSCGIVHGDIKPDNILIFTGRGVRYTAKLSDFGFSITQETTLQTGTRDKTPEPMWKLTGRTWPWNDPECNFPRTWIELMKTDVFSYGLLSWEILCERPIEVLFDLPVRGDQDFSITPSMREIVEDVKKDGTLGKNAATFFSDFDPLVQIFTTCLFEFCLHPASNLRATSGDICLIWDLWFNE